MCVHKDGHTSFFGFPSLNTFLYIEIVDRDLKSGSFSIKLVNSLLQTEH